MRAGRRRRPPARSASRRRARRGARAGEVELALAVDARQLGRLAAEERTASGAADRGHALDELGHLLEVELARGHVVEEEKRGGAGGGDVIDAMSREVGARVVEAAGAPGEHDLRPETVGRGSQEALLVESEEACEAAKLAERRRGPGRVDGGPQPLDDVGGLCQRNPGLLVAHDSTTATSSGRPSGPAGRKRTTLSPTCTSLESR